MNYKLTPGHIDLQHFNKMKVAPAAQLLSDSTASAIEVLHLAIQSFNLYYVRQNGSALSGRNYT